MTTSFTPLPKAIATVCLTGSLPEKLQAAAAVGFDGVEIFENDLLTFDGSPADVRSICDGLGLAIPLYQPLRDFECMPEPQRTRNLDRAERKFDVMQALGTDLVLVCSNMQPAAIDDPARAVEDLAAIAERAQIFRCDAVVIDRVGRDVAAHQHQVGAELLHHVELQFGAVEILRHARARRRLEVAERLEQQDAQAQVGRDALHVTRRAIEIKQVVLEDLHAIEAGRRNRIQLLHQRAAE